jgi:hypothetical protein
LLLGEQVAHCYLKSIRQLLHIVQTDVAFDVQEAKTPRSAGMRESGKRSIR